MVDEWPVGFACDGEVSVDGLIVAWLDEFDCWALVDSFVHENRDDALA